MKSVIVIPARLASTRLPRKMLLKDSGRTLIEHTYRAASRSRLASTVIVATDHQEIFEVVTGFGGQAVMTRADHPSGSDRVAEVAGHHSDIDIWVNVQGDEPEILGSSIDLAIQRLIHTPDAAVATLATPIRQRIDLDDPACVKVVFANDGRALYFSRSPIPHARNWQDDLLQREPACFYQHVGLYAFRREYLLQLSSLAATQLEQLESLEQLRFLNSNWPVYVDVIQHSATGIDTPEDYASFVRRQANC